MSLFTVTICPFWQAFCRYILTIVRRGERAEEWSRVLPSMQLINAASRKRTERPWAHKSFFRTLSYSATTSYRFAMELPELHLTDEKMEQDITYFQSIWFYGKKLSDCFRVLPQAAKYGTRIGTLKKMKELYIGICLTKTSVLRFLPRFFRCVLWINPATNIFIIETVFWCMNLSNCYNVYCRKRF